MAGSIPAEGVLIELKVYMSDSLGKKDRRWIEGYIDLLRSVSVNPEGARVLAQAEETVEISYVTSITKEGVGRGKSSIEFFVSSELAEGLHRELVLRYPELTSETPDTINIILHEHDNSMEFDWLVGTEHVMSVVISKETGLVMSLVS